MKPHFRLFSPALLLASAAALAFACQKEQEGKEPDAQLELSVGISGTTESSAQYTVTASEQEATYLHGVARLEYFAGFESPDKFIESRLEDIRTEAQAQGSTFEGYLAGFLGSGDRTYTCDTLASETEYVAYAAGVASDGTITGKTASASFTTGQGSSEGSLFTFEPKMLDDLSANITVTPSQEIGWYFCRTVDQTVLEWKYGGLETLQENMEEEFVTIIAELVEYMHYDIPTAVAAICWQKQQVFPVRKMVPSTKHYTLAAGVDQGTGTISSKVCYGTYESGPGGSLEGFTIDFTIGDVVINMVEVKTTPSADNVRYYFDRTQLDVPDDEIIDYLYGNIQTFIDSGLVADANGFFAQWCSIGPDVFTYTNLAKGTYRIFGFGIGNDGQPATDTMFSEPFTVTM